MSKGKVKVFSIVIFTIFFISSCASITLTYFSVSKNFNSPFVNSITWNPDGTNFILQDNGKILFYDISKSNPIQTISKDNPLDASYSPDGSILAVLLAGRIDLYDTTTVTFLSSIFLNISPNKISWSPNGMELALADSSHIWIYDPITNTVVNSIYKSNASFNNLKWSPDSKFVAANTNTGITIMNANTNTSVDVTISGPFDWDNTGGNISIMSQNILYIWNINQTQIIKEYSFKGILDIDWNSNGKYISLISDHILYIFDTAHEKITDSYYLMKDDRNLIAWHPTSNYVLYGNDGFRIAQIKDGKITNKNQFLNIFMKSPLIANTDLGKVNNLNMILIVVSCVFVLLTIVSLVYLRAQLKGSEEKEFKSSKEDKASTKKDKKKKKKEKFDDKIDLIQEETSSHLSQFSNYSKDDLIQEIIAQHKQKNYDTEMKLLKNLLQLDVLSEEENLNWKNYYIELTKFMIDEN